MVLMSPALAGRFFTSTATWEAPQNLDGMKVTQMYVYAFVKVHGTVHLTSTHVQHYHTVVFFKINYIVKKIICMPLFYFNFFKKYNHPDYLFK